MTTRTEQIREQVKQVQELRQLCKSMMEQQMGLFQRVSDKLDALELDLAVSYAEEMEGGAPNAQ